MTKEMFLKHLYGDVEEPEIKIIDVFVCKLRKKLADASGGQPLHRDRLGARLHTPRPPARYGRPECPAMDRHRERSGQRDSDVEHNLIRH